MTARHAHNITITTTPPISASVLAALLAVGRFAALSRMFGYADAQNAVETIVGGYVASLSFLWLYDWCRQLTHAVRHMSPEEIKRARQGIEVAAARIRERESEPRQYTVWTQEVPGRHWVRADLELEPELEAALSDIAGALLLDEVAFSRRELADVLTQRQYARFRDAMIEAGYATIDGNRTKLTHGGEQFLAEFLPHSEA